MTPNDNINKERANKPKRKDKELPKNKVYTLEYINSKIDQVEAEYEKAKAEHNADRAHSLRTSRTNWRNIKEQFLASPELQKRAEEYKAMLERRTKLKTLRNELKITVSEQGRNSKKAKELRTLIKELKQNL